jgi:RimJ/RimL family protein N-acetyltransferase
MNTNELIVRSSRKADMKQLYELDCMIWNEKNTPAVIKYSGVKEYEEKHPVGNQHVAVINGNVVGYVFFQPPTPLATNLHVLEIAIGVHHDFQGRGVGKNLIHFMMDWSKKNKIRKLSLRVLSTNKEAIAFYHAMGFKEQGRLVSEFFINGEYVDDVLMYHMVN